MSKPLNSEMNLSAEVEKYEGDDKSLGDPSSPEYVDPEAKQLESDNEDEADDTSDAEENEETSDEGEEENAETEDDKKPKKNAQTRINELTAARREAERQAEYWRNRAQEAQRAAQSVGTQEKTEEPDPSKFDYGEADPNYYRALARYEAKKELDAARVNQAQTQHTEALQGAMNATISRGRANFADFDNVVVEGAAKGVWDCSEDLAMQLIDSEKGDEIAYFLAKNPAEARRLSALPFRSLAREVGKLELQLEVPAAKPKVVSDAPPPPKRTAKGGARSGGFDPSAGAYDADFEKWATGAMNRRR